MMVSSDKNTTTSTPACHGEHETSQNIALRDLEKSASDREDLSKDLSSLEKWRKWSLFGCSCLLQFLLQLDMASVAVTLPKIAKDLAASHTIVFIVATGYFLAQTVFQLAFSHVSHAMGRKYAYMAGVGFYIVGAIIAATSTGTSQLLAARVMQGIGAAGMFTMSAIVIVEIMQPRQRAAWTAISQACGALGNICGPLFAGLLFKKFNWRSIFWMETLAASTLLVSLLFLLPNWRTRPHRPLQVLKHCDWAGILLFLIASVMCLVPINIGGTVKSWDSPAVISCFGVGVVSLIILGYHQRYIAKNPAFPREIFKKGVTNAAFLGSMVSGMLLSIVFYNLVLFWEGVRQFPTMKVGVMMLSVTLTYTLCAAVAGTVIRICGYIKWATVTGSLCSIVGLGLMYFLDDTRPVGPLVVISMVAAVGCGIFLPAMINTILASTDKQWHSHAIAMRTMLYTAGQCMGISMGLAIFTNSFEHEIARIHRAEAVQQAVFTPQNLMSVIKDLPSDSEVIGVMVYALRWVWGAACALALVVGTLTSIFKCPALPEDNKTNSESSGAEDDTQQDEVDSQRHTNSSLESIPMSVFSEPEIIRLRPSPRIHITRVPSSENPARFIKPMEAKIEQVSDSEL